MAKKEEPALRKHAADIPTVRPHANHGRNKPVGDTMHPPPNTRIVQQQALPDPVARARGGDQRELPRPATSLTAQTAPTRIKVRATRQGYYDHIRRHDGDVFYIAKAEDFSEKWMVRVDARTPERVTSAPDNLRRTHDEILASRMPASGTPLVDDEPDAATNNPLDA